MTSRNASPSYPSMETEGKRSQTSSPSRQSTDAQTKSDFFGQSLKCENRGQSSVFGCPQQDNSCQLLNLSMSKSSKSEDEPCHSTINPQSSKTHTTHRDVTGCSSVSSQSDTDEPEEDRRRFPGANYHDPRFSSSSELSQTSREKLFLDLVTGGVMGHRLTPHTVFPFGFGLPNPSTSFRGLFPGPFSGHPGSRDPTAPSNYRHSAPGATTPLMMAMGTQDLTAPFFDGSSFDLHPGKKRRIIPPSSTTHPKFNPSVRLASSPSSALGVDPVNRDSAYLERRRKNNEAAKRSRDLRRQKETDTAIKANYLLQENIRLKIEVQYLTQELNYLRNNYCRV